MSKCDLRVEDGRLKVSGEMTFATVTGLLDRSKGLFEQVGESVEVDLGSVERVDSAGLALLIEWMRMARAGEKTIRFVSLPEQMRAIAAASDLDDILPTAS